MTADWYRIDNAAEISSPSLLLWPDRVEHNIRRMLEWVDGHAERLRPHVKTYKMREVVKMQLEAGITRFKAATIAELEMTALAGAPDVLMAYQPVGPNIQRLSNLCRRFPDVSFSAIVDDPAALEVIGAAFHAAGQTLPLYVDIDCGMHRTGLPFGDAARDLCKRVAATPGVAFAGLHVYDGHLHDRPVDAREARFRESIGPEPAFIASLAEDGLAVPAIVAGGSPSLGLQARYAVEAANAGLTYECSPGTAVIWDMGYADFPDLGFLPSLVILTRVISKPCHNRLCLDVGNKAVASEQPLENRVRLPDLPDAVPVVHNEEHFVVETGDADDYEVGDVLYGIPVHVCPTVASHEDVTVVRDGHATEERWQVEARVRRISV